MSYPFIIRHGSTPIGEVRAETKYHAIDKFVNLQASRGVEITRLYLKATRKN